MKYIHIYYISFLFLSVFSFSQERILIEGSVVDESNFEIPYAAVGIIKKNLGTTSTSEGTFSFIVTTDELEDDLEISSIGFETFKINVRDFINSINKKITLEEKTTQLNEAVVYSPLFYIKNAFKTNKGYNWRFEDLEKRSKKNYYFFRKIFKFTEIKKSDQILDFGSGYGPLLHILKKKNFKAYGLEPSIKNSTISKKLGHKVVNGYLNDKTFGSKKFKIIVFPTPTSP